MNKKNYTIKSEKYQCKNKKKKNEKKGEENEEENAPKNVKSIGNKPAFSSNLWRPQMCMKRRRKQKMKKKKFVFIYGLFLIHIHIGIVLYFISHLCEVACFDTLFTKTGTQFQR